MKRILIFLLGIIFLSLGCKKNVQNNNAPFILKIESTVKDIDEVRLVGYLGNGTRTIIGRGVPTQGGYTVTIENPLQPIYLYSISGIPDYKEHFKFSNSNVMCYNAVYFFDAYRNNRYVGTFSKVDYIGAPKKDIEWESHWLKYIYVTEDVSITGVQMENGNPYQTYDLHLKRGWNEYAQIDYRHSGNKNYVESLFTSEIPAGVKWKLNVTGPH